MNIKEAATRAGVSHQAIYKRLIKRGIDRESLIDKETGEITEEGLAILIELYPQIAVEESKPEVVQPDATPEEVARLREEVQLLRNQLHNLEEKVVALTDERDYLRKLLDHSQEMEGLRARLEVVEAGQRAAQAKAITDGSDERSKRRGPFSWLRNKSTKGAG